MNYHKRFISMVTLFIFLMTLLPVAAFAASPSAVVNGTPRDGDRQISVTLRNFDADDHLWVRSSHNKEVGYDIFHTAFSGPRVHTMHLKEPLVAGRAYFVDVRDVSAGKVMPRVKFVPVRASSDRVTVGFLDTVYVGDTSVRLVVHNAAENDVIRLYQGGRSTPVAEHFLTNAEAKQGRVEIPLKVRSGSYLASINNDHEDYVLAQSTRKDFVPDASRVQVDRSEDPFTASRDDVPVSLYLRDRSGRLVRDASAWVYVWAEDVEKPGVSPALYAPEGVATKGVVTLGVTEGRLVDYPLRFDRDGQYILKASLDNPLEVRNPELFGSNTAKGDPITVGAPGYTGYTMDVSYNGITQRDLGHGDTARRAVAVVPRSEGTFVELTFLDRNDGAVENARVNVGTDSSRISLDRNSAVTDGDGKITFRVSGDIPGTYAITLRTEGFRVELPVEVGEVVPTRVHTIDLNFEEGSVRHIKPGEGALHTLPVIAGGNGTPVNLTAYDAAGDLLGSGQAFTLSTDSADIWLDHTALETDSAGEFDFRVYGDTPGEYEVILRTGANSYYLPVHVHAEAPKDGVSSALLTINNATIITDNTIREIDTPPVIKEARTFVPYRALAEAFGAQVVWNENTREVTVADRGQTIVMAIGSTTYTVNGESREMDVAPYIENSRTMVPVRFIAEGMAFAVDVTYHPDGTTHQVLFTR